MTTYRQFCAAFLALGVLACSHVPRATENGSIKNLWEGISTNTSIRVRGVGAASPKTRGLTARRGLSRSAALVDARFNLLSTIKGVRVSAGITIAQLMEKGSLVRELANDLVKGGEEVLTEWTDDGGCVVTLELKRGTVERLIQEKSEREKGLEKRVARDIAEIKKLNKLLAVALYGDVPLLPPDMVQAITAKAEAFESVQEQSDVLLARTGSDNPPTMQEIVDVMSRITAAKAMPIRPEKETDDQAFIDQIGQEVRGNHKHPGYTKEQWCVLFDTPDCHQ